MAGVAFLDLMAARTLGGLKRQLLSLAVANALPVTSFVEGDPTERWLDITPRMINQVLSGIITQAVRGFFLDFATDPGDEGDLSTDQTPRAGFLSALGEGWYGTTRRGETYSTTFLTVQNTGSAPAVFAPFSLTFTTAPPGSGPSGGGEAAKSDGGRPTFRNTGDGGIYTDIGGTVTIAPGGAKTIPVACEQIGTYGSVSVNSLVFAGSTTGAVLTVTASSLAIGQGRESADSYRARCKLASAGLAPGGPQRAYIRAATTARDGTPLQRHDGTGPVGITKVYASPQSSTGQVVVYYADDDGAADATDVQSASVNTLGLVLGVIVDPLGVVPDAVTFGNTTSTYGGLLPAGTPIGAAATEVPISITATAKIKSRPGMADATLKAAAEAAVLLAWGAYFARTPIGGNDQTAGAGTVSTADLSGVVYATRLAGEAQIAGLHAVSVSAPAGSSTAIAVGQVAKLGSPSITVTVVP